MKKKKEVEKREKEVFDYAARYDRRSKSITKPKPFNLSKAPRKFSVRKKKIMKEKDKKEEFKPCTMESKRKKIVKEFLENYA